MGLGIARARLVLVPATGRTRTAFAAASDPDPVRVYKHVQVFALLQIPPQRVQAHLLLFTGREVARQKHFQHGFDRRPAVLRVQTEGTRAHPPQPEKRRGVLQRPVRLAAFLDVVHPDHPAFVVRPTHRAVRGQKRGLRGQQPVRRRGLVRTKPKVSAARTACFPGLET